MGKQKTKDGREVLAHELTGATEALRREIERVDGALLNGRTIRTADAEERAAEVVRLLEAVDAVDG